MQEIIVSNPTPNDHGYIIPNESIDWSRFNKNPIMLQNHDWDEPIGFWSGLRLGAEGWIATPNFVGNFEGKEWKVLYSEGAINAASIGGILTSKTDSYGKAILKDGYKIAEKFEIYEISLVTIPSNPDAVKLNSIKLYSQTEISTFMSKKNEKEEPEKVEETKQVQNPEIKEDVQDKKEKTVKKAKPFIIKKLESILTAIEKLSSNNVLLNAEKDGDKDKDDMEELEKSINGCDKMESLESLLSEYNINELSSEIREKIKAKMESLGIISSENQSKEETIKLKSNIINMEEPIKTEKTELKTVAQPDKKNVQTKDFETFSSLLRKKSPEQILQDCQTTPEAKINILESIMNDPKYANVLNVMRFWGDNQNLSQENISAIQKDNYDFRAGNNNGVKSLISRMKQTQFGASDDLLTTPDLLKVEWLTMTLSRLFPNTGWKRNINLFSASQTESSRGLIWTNIEADPDVYEGANPSPATAYSYVDQAVSLAMRAFWLQPILWTPNYMHQIVYDQQSTGWAQSLKKLELKMDEYLIYLLAVAANAAVDLKNNKQIVATSGASSFDCSLPDNSFLWNEDFTGTLAKANPSDIVKLEKLFNRINIPNDEMFDLLQCSVTFEQLTNAETAKNVLYRYVDANDKNLMSYKRANMLERYRVALYNTATKSIVDPSGVIAAPETTIGANIAFMGNKVGIGVGRFDVFQVIDPRNYGLVLSADIRTGLAPLYKDSKGLAIYTFGQPTV